MLVETKSIMVVHLQGQKTPLQQLLNHINPNFHFF